MSDLTYAQAAVSQAIAADAADSVWFAAVLLRHGSNCSYAAQQNGGPLGCPEPFELRMSNSKAIAGLIGPTIVAMVVSEFPLVQPHLYDAQIPPVVYLSGTLMFVAGLAIVRAHNRWTRDWTVLVTLSGWFFLVLGLFRMFAAGTYQRTSANTSATVFMILEGMLAILGLFLTFKAYSRNVT